jgi:hypothetical protein
MNKLIEQLVERAGGSIGTGLEFAVVFGETEDVKKFVELIVWECVSTVEGMAPGYKDYRDQIEDAFRRDCVAEIKHKFGVKE